MSFKVGDKVICINDVEHGMIFFAKGMRSQDSFLKLGEIYTIQDLEPERSVQLVGSCNKYSVLRFKAAEIPPAQFSYNKSVR